MTCEESRFSFIFFHFCSKYLSLFLFFSDQNCGGDGNTFIFFPIQGEEACVPKEFEVTVTISDGNLVSSSTIPLCETVPLLPPSGGRCVASDDCGVPFSEIEIECRFIFFLILFLILFECTHINLLQ